MGLIHTRSLRDECNARASTLQYVRFLMLERLSEETRAIPEVAELYEILHESEQNYWTRGTEADRTLEREVRTAQANLRSIGI